MIRRDGITFNRNLLLVLFTFLSIIAFSQAPQKLTYQAVIRDASNNLLANTTVSIKVSILQGSATGTPVFQELHYNKCKRLS